MPYDSLTTLIGNWHNEHDFCPDCPEGQIDAADARHAAKVGLPTLAALLDALSQVRQANDQISRAEFEALLRPIVCVARGEAEERMLQLTGSEPGSFYVPGVATIPDTLLERQFGHHDEEQAIEEEAIDDSPPAEDLRGIRPARL